MFDHIPPVAGIYAIVNTLNGRRYVGQAKNMNARVRSHVRNWVKVPIAPAKNVSCKMRGMSLGGRLLRSLFWNLCPTIALRRITTSVQTIFP
jgi:hypothetical protein